MNQMKKKIKENNKRFSENTGGFFSILYVILAFIACIIITGMIDIMKESYSINEVQGIMDVAGVSALNASIDREEIRNDEFKYNENKAKVVFREIMESRIGNSTMIDSYEIVDLRITNQGVSDFGLGEGNVTAQQIILDSTILLRVNTSMMFDIFPQVQKQYYRSYLGDSVNVSISGQTEDGQTELLVRSVSRLVYR